jgi:hypothetical protein
MANMHPRRLRVDTKSNAERQLYEAFEDNHTLSNEFDVFHSVRWLIRDPRSGAEDGEADFVIAHPELGVLILEVKGGAIRYDGRLAQWFSYDIPISDPVDQARRSKYSLLDKLKGLPAWRNRWITLGHAVAFPDISVDHDLLPDLPEDIVLDGPALRDLEGWVRQALAYWHGHDRQVGGVGREGMEVLRDILSPSWGFQPLLCFELEEEGRKIDCLTAEQFQVLDLLRGHRRALIVGCAGSGKTMLALEQARRLGREGFRVLLTCFNRFLADRLQEVELPEGVDVQNFHRLVPALVKEAGLRGELDERKFGLDSDTYYTEVFPDFVVKAAEILGPRYDALIVDEGQDFDGTWFLALATLLRDPDHAIVYVFKDDNQNLFHPRFDLPWEMSPFYLTRNCRNTRHIHELVVQFYRAEQTPLAVGPPGRPVEIHTYGDQVAFDDLLRRLVHQVLVEKKVSNEDVVILSCGRSGYLHPGKRYGNFVLSERWPPASGELYWTTVQSFKGLESPVVILAELDEQAFPDLVTVAYVGMSRARSHLIVLADEYMPDAVKSILMPSAPEDLLGG